MIQGSRIKTKDNDYLALDGLWYPSNKLDGYLKQKPSFSNAQLELLAKYYEDAIKDSVWDINPLLERLAKK